MEYARAKVVAHKRQYLVDEIVLVGQSFKEAPGRGLSFRFVAARRDAAKISRGRRRFAEIVTEDGKADDHIVVVLTVAFPGEPVQAMERVDPDITLRVPDRILLAALECREFRVEAEPTAVAQELQTQ